jgi:hypothetical protein
MQTTIAAVSGIPSHGDSFAPTVEHPPVQERVSRPEDSRVKTKVKLLSYSGKRR